MKPRPFDEYDLRVFQAHSLAEDGSGGADPETLRLRHEGPLPPQRLSGMARRGLMRLDRGRWYLTPRGIAEAVSYQERRDDA